MLAWLVLLVLAWPARRWLQGLLAWLVWVLVLLVLAWLSWSPWLLVLVLEAGERFGGRLLERTLQSIGFGAFPGLQTL